MYPKPALKAELISEQSLKTLKLFLSEVSAVSEVPNTQLPPGWHLMLNIVMIRNWEAKGLRARCHLMRPRLKGLVGRRRRDAALRSQAWDGLQACGLRKTRGFGSQPWLRPSVGKLRLCIHSPSILFLRKEELGCFLILKLAPACYIRKQKCSQYRKLPGRLGDPQVASQPKACL